MTCPKCSVEVTDAADFCHKCGANLDTSQDEPGPMPDPPAAADSSDAASRFRTSVAARQSHDDDDDVEHHLWDGRYSPKAMLGTWIGMGLLTLVALIGGAFVWADGLLYIFGALVVIWLLLLARLMFRRYSVRYRLTNQRFIHERGLLSRTADRIEVIDMDDITFFQGPIQRLVGVGKITVTSSDRTHPEITLPGIEDVERVATLMDDARRTERHRRGLHIEAI